MAVKDIKCGQWASGTALLISLHFSSCKFKWLHVASGCCTGKPRSTEVTTCAESFPLALPMNSFHLEVRPLASFEGDLMKHDSNLSQGCNERLPPTSLNIA